MFFQKQKKIIYLIWLSLIGLLLIAYLKNPQIATPKYIVQFIKEFETNIFLVYIGLSLVRGFFLIPSTPFVIGGGLLFPDKLLLVLIVSMLGVLFSALSLYYFADLLGFSKYLEKKYPSQVKIWEDRLNEPKATLYVLAWSFFPLVPTDLICYVAGIVKMRIIYVLMGVFFGELTLNILYVYFGQYMNFML